MKVLIVYPLAIAAMSLEGDVRSWGHECEYVCWANNAERALLDRDFDLVIFDPLTKNSHTDGEIDWQTLAELKVRDIKKFPKLIIYTAMDSTEITEWLAANSNIQIDAIFEVLHASETILDAKHEGQPRSLKQVVDEIAAQLALPQSGAASLNERGETIPARGQ